jgi:hypothetical protein
MVSGGVRGLLVSLLVAGACAEPVGPGRSSPARPSFDASGGGIALDQWSGTLAESGTVLCQGFQPANPHVGDAIVVTFFWLGSSNVITSVTDRLSNGTPVGNTYHLVEYVTTGGISMATYVATNVENFPDGYSGSAGDSILAVQADLSAPVTDGGIKLSAWTGVNGVYAQALGAHQSATGADSTTTIAGPGAVTAAAGALVYGVTMTDGLVGFDPPPGFAEVAVGTDAAIKNDGEYTVPAATGSVEPRWTWYFTAPSAWLTTVLALNPAPPAPPPPALDRWIGTMNESGTQLIKGFNFTNPHVGDAIVATFFWIGSTNIIDSVTDVLTTAPFTPVGNTYHLVDYVTAGGISMATYAATNVEHFPDAYDNPKQDSILAVRANLSQAVTDGGLTLTAYTGVNATYAEALGASQSGSGSGSSTTTADPGAIAVNARSLVYGVTMSDGLVVLGSPGAFTVVVQGTDASLKQGTDYMVSASPGSVEPRWTWHFDAEHPGTWLATVFALNGQ